jgi:ankyrin repeat protein
LRRVLTPHDRSTAFLVACGHGHVGCVETLMAAGCDTAATDSNDCTGLIYAATYGHTAVVERLLALGMAELEAVSKIGSTAFLGACLKGHLECAEALVAAGCDTAVKTNDGRTATQLAQVIY